MSAARTVAGSDGMLPCNHCGGRGRLTVAGRNLHVLEALEARHDRERNTVEIHAIIVAQYGYVRESHSATVNALTAMKREGFVLKLGRQGRAFRWRITAAGAHAAHVGGLAETRERNW